MGRRFKLDVGLALGGGAARGMAHVGVLRVLHREGVPIDAIAGTSMGAIIGGAFIAERDVDALETRVRDVLTSEQFQKNRISFLKETKRERGGLFFSVANLVRRGVFFGVSNLRSSFMSAEDFARSLEAIVPDVLIEELDVPFGAVALDLHTADEVLITRGSLRRAVAASAAIPGILPPVKMNDRVLIDGGWVDKIPALPTFTLGADVVIAVDISADLQDAREFRRGMDIMVRANSIKDALLAGHSRRRADLVVEPDVGGIHWADFESFEQCIQAGEEAAMRMIPAIRRMLRRERFLSLIRPSRGKRHARWHLREGDGEVHTI